MNHTVEIPFLVKGNIAFVHFSLDFVSSKMVHENKNESVILVVLTEVNMMIMLV
jgi:hypothetical protein